MNWRYERLKADGTVETVSEGMNDANGRITGKHIINVKAWLDENPEEAIRGGWTKHLYYGDFDEIDLEFPYNRQTEVRIRAVERVDAHTVRDIYHVIPKSESMMALEEMLEVLEEGTITIGATTWLRE